LKGEECLIFKDSFACPTLQVDALNFAGKQYQWTLGVLFKNRMAVDRQYLSTSIWKYDVAHIPLLVSILNLEWKTDMAAKWDFLSHMWTGLNEIKFGVGGKSQF
jgi:hypothetical protein